MTAQSGTLKEDTDHWGGCLHREFLQPAVLKKLPKTNAKWIRIHAKAVFGLLRRWPGPPGVARVDLLQIRSGFVVDFRCICHRFWRPLATPWGALATKCHPEVDFGRHCGRCLWSMLFVSVPGSSLGGADM